MWWTRLCLIAATVLVSVTYIYVCVCVSLVCSGCVMQCGMLLVPTTFYLHNKPLLCRANCSVYWLTSTFVVSRHLHLCCCCYHHCYVSPFFFAGGWHWSETWPAHWALYGRQKASSSSATPPLTRFASPLNRQCHCSSNNFSCDTLPQYHAS